MLSREDFYMIKQLRKQGAHIVDIAHRLGCSERTVRRQLALPAPNTGRRTQPRPGKLDPFKGFIDQQLAEGVWNAEVILHKIRDLGYSGGATLVRGYIQPKRALRPSRKTVRFETSPGYQLQHDWGNLETFVAGERCKVHIAVNELGYSRRFHVWAAPCEDAEHTYESLIRAFRHFGGVSNHVLVDNQKAAVISHTVGGDVRFNEGFLQLAQHYGFTPKACRPHRPRTKGKVERMVGYVKDHFFQCHQRFESWAHLNQLLEHWLASVADNRPLRQFEQSPAQRFTDERDALQPLPATDFDTSYRDLRQVGWDGYIEVRGNRYSVPEGYCGQGVSIRIGLDGTLRVYDRRDQPIAEHPLQSRAQGWQTTPAHHTPLWQSVGVQQRDLSEYQEVLS